MSYWMTPNSTATTRRRILLGLGTGAVVGLAGCAGDGEDGSDGDNGTNDSDGSDGGNGEDGMDGDGGDGSDGTDGDDGDDGEDDETPSESANVRVAHMSPDAPNVDVLVDGSAALEDVPFGAVSPYLEVPAGDREVEITAAGDPDTSVFAGTVPVEAETDYTVAAIGEIGENADQPFEPLVLEDDNSDPGSDTARVRLVHASPDAPAVDVTVGSSGDLLFDGAGYGDASYVEVPGGDYTLDVRGDTESNDGDVAASFDVSVAGGQVYTAFAAGYLTPDDEPADTAFDLVVVQDTGDSM